jgi:hypothetical protein
MGNQVPFPYHVASVIESPAIKILSQRSAAAWVDQPGLPGRISR